MTVSPHMSAGEFNCYAELQGQSRVPDGAGGWITSWQHLRFDWISLRELAQRETLQAMQPQSPVTHEIMARYAQDVTADKRYVHNDIPYNIRAVTDVSGGRELLRVLAESGVAT